MRPSAAAVGQHGVCEECCRLHVVIRYRTRPDCIPLWMPMLALVTPWPIRFLCDTCACMAGLIRPEVTA